MENAYIINGGKPLQGEVLLSGSKNVALKTLIAALLFESEVVLKNIPQIDDVEELIHLITLLGGKVERDNAGTVTVDGRKLRQNRVDLLHGSKIRVSFMLFAPLLKHFREAYIPNPGGCRLGARSIDRIVDGMKAVGIDVEYDSSTGFYHAALTGGVEGSYRFVKPSHTGTELLIMTGLLSDTGIVIENAALEPEIDDLIKFLNESGGNIVREGRQIRVAKKHVLKQEKPYTITADRNEAITFAALGQMTKGNVTVSYIEEAYIGVFVEKFRLAGGGVEKLSENKWKFYYKGPLKAIDITTEPFPGFMTDWQPIWAILMTQANGSSIIHERLFENRFSYVEELCKLGASIEYIDIPVENPEMFYFFNYVSGHKYHQSIRISGGKPMHNGVVTISDLRAGATLAIAALSVPGESVVNGISNIHRGYEKFVEKIRLLGGDIRQV